jgi:hypothetical protein
MLRSQQKQCDAISYPILAVLLHTTWHRKQLIPNPCPTLLHRNDAPIACAPYPKIYVVPCSTRHRHLYSWVKGGQMYDQLYPPSLYLLVTGNGNIIAGVVITVTSCSADMLCILSERRTFSPSGHFHNLLVTSSSLRSG